jgi:hypothetical protein
MGAPGAGTGAVTLFNCRTNPRRAMSARAIRAEPSTIVSVSDAVAPPVRRPVGPLVGWRPIVTGCRPAE